MSSMQIINIPRRQRRQRTTPREQFIPGYPMKQAKELCTDLGKHETRHDELVARLGRLKLSELGVPVKGAGCQITSEERAFLVLYYEKGNLFGMMHTPEWHELYPTLAAMQEKNPSAYASLQARLDWRPRSLPKDQSTALFRANHLIYFVMNMSVDIFTPIYIYLYITHYHIAITLRSLTLTHVTIFLHLTMFWRYFDVRMLAWEVHVLIIYVRALFSYNLQSKIYVHH